MHNSRSSRNRLREKRLRKRPAVPPPPPLQPSPLPSHQCCAAHRQEKCIYLSVDPGELQYHATEFSCPADLSLTSLLVKQPPLLPRFHPCAAFSGADPSLARQRSWRTLRCTLCWCARCCPPPRSHMSTAQARFWRPLHCARL
jgi:hypothetical protein